jgi:hypothetical protein
MASNNLARVPFSSELTWMKAMVEPAFLWIRCLSYTFPWCCSRESPSYHTGQVGRQLFSGICARCSHHQLSLFVLTRGMTVLSCAWWTGDLCGGIFFASCILLSQANSYCFCCYFFLWSLLVDQLEQVGGCLVIQYWGKLANCRRHFQLLIEDSLLPLHLVIVVLKAGELPFGMDVLFNEKIYRYFLKWDLLLS